MTIRKIIRRVAIAAIAFSGMGMADAYAQSEQGVDITSLPPNVRAAIVGALSKGDYDGATKLIRSVPSAKLFTRNTPPSPPPPDSSYESLTGCGFYPQLTRLECTVEIKQTGTTARNFPGFTMPIGYGGLLGGWGSQENVDFCINIIPMDFNTTPPIHIWMPVGRGTVIVHDQRPSGKVTGPWEYAVYRDFDPISGPRVALNGADTTPTISAGYTYEVKAILWWYPPLYALFGTIPPPDPLVNCSYVPQYGDIKTFLVRGDPIR